MLINEHEQFWWEEDIDYVSDVSKTKGKFLDRSLPDHLIFTRSIAISCLHLIDEDTRYYIALSSLLALPFDWISQSNTWLDTAIILHENRIFLFFFFFEIKIIRIFFATMKWRKIRDKCEKNWTELSDSLIITLNPCPHPRSNFRFTRWLSKLTAIRSMAQVGSDGFMVLLFFSFLFLAGIIN